MPGSGGGEVPTCELTAGAGRSHPSPAGALLSPPPDRHDATTPAPPWERLDDEYAESWEDPIVAEVRAARAAPLAEAGGTLEGLYRLLKEVEAHEAAAGVEYIQPPPQPGGTRSS